VRSGRGWCSIGLRGHGPLLAYHEWIPEQVLADTRSSQAAPSTTSQEARLAALEVVGSHVPSMIQSNPGTKVNGSASGDPTNVAAAAAVALLATSPSSTQSDAELAKAVEAITLLTSTL
jgi:hypothetical protein